MPQLRFIPNWCYSTFKIIGPKINGFERWLRISINIVLLGFNQRHLSLLKLKSLITAPNWFTLNSYYRSVLTDYLRLNFKFPYHFKMITQKCWFHVCLMQQWIPLILIQSWNTSFSILHLFRVPFLQVVA